MTNLKAAVEQCFSANGWLVSSKQFRHEPAQLAYALDVVEWLQGRLEQPVGLLEGDTGVGKTLAYLIPLFISTRLSGLRGVIATHTIALQNQMLESDVGIANEYLEFCGFVPCSIQQLIGRQSYVDPEKVEHRLNMLQEDGYVVSESREIISAAFRCAKQDGLIESFFLEIGGEPEYFNAADICIDEESIAAVNLGFDRQWENVILSDVVITSHTMLLLNRNYFNNTLFENDELPLGPIVIDEADLLTQSASMFSSNKLHPKQLVTTLNKLYHKLTAKEKKLFSEVKSAAYDLDSALRNIGSAGVRRDPILIDNLKPHHKTVVVDGLNKINSLCGQLSSLNRRVNLDATEQVAKNYLDNIQAFFSSFQASIANGESSCGINWSETLGIPSLQIAQAYPARRMLNYIFSKEIPKCRLLFTSATLSDGRDKGFRNAKINIQLLSDKFYCIQATHSPLHFGTARFVLTKNSIPAPISVVDETVLFNQGWMRHTASLISVAASLGNTMVLCNSFHEGSAIAKRIKTDKPIYLHAPGISLMSLLEAFRSTGGVIISPSAWEGISVRSMTGKQLITELVITRAPYSPPNQFQALVLREYLTKKGLSLAKANSLIRGSVILSTVRKLRQGIGRLIRSFSDNGTIWICDPRVPVFNATRIHKQDDSLVRAIPGRFMDSYRNASVFDTETNKVINNEKKSNVPAEIEVWL